MAVIKYDPNVHYGYYANATYKKDPDKIANKEFNRKTFITKGILGGAALIGGGALAIGEAPRVGTSIALVLKRKFKDAVKVFHTNNFDTFPAPKRKMRVIVPLLAATAGAVLGGVVNHFTSKEKALYTWDSMSEHKQYLKSLKDEYFVLPHVFEGVLIKKTQSK